MISYCENCEQTKKDLNETKSKLAEFQSLAKRIVQTDLVLRKFSDKEAECLRLADELRNKERDYDHLNDKYKNVVKELEAHKKQSKETSKEKADVDKIFKEKDEIIEKLTKNEFEMIQKIEEFSQKEDDFLSKSNEYTKQILNLKSELRLMSEKFDQTSDELRKLKVLYEASKTEQASHFEYKNIKTSTQILNVNISTDDSTFPEPDKKESPKKKNDFKGFYISSESSSEEEEEKVEIKTTDRPFENLSSLSQDDVVNIDQLVVSKQSEVKTEQTNQKKQVKFGLYDSSEENEQTNDIKYSESESSSSSETESDTSSSSSSSKESKNDMDDLFGFQISDDENDSKKDDTEKSFDVFNIQQDFEKSQLESEKRENEKEEILKKEAEEKEKKLNLEIDQKTDSLSTELSKVISENFIEEMIEQVNTEQTIIEFIRDKLLNEEINSKNSLTASILKSICITTIDEERNERKKLEKIIREEIRATLVEEIYEKIFDEKYNQLIKECCERVLAEDMNEKVDKIYHDLVDEVYKQTFEKCLLDLIFEDMNSVPKKFIEKLKLKEIKIKHFENKSNKRRLSSDVEEKFELIESEKRPRRESFGSEASWKSSVCFGEDSEKKTLEEFVKECLADYFRKFNFKIEFTFEELDELIDRLARAVKKKNLYTDNSKFIARILVKHYINNKFIPLDDNKLNQVDESELKLFKQISIIKNTSIKDEFESITRTIYGKKSSQSSYMLHLQTKLNEIMLVKITNEEEKYVYILNKLKDYPGLGPIQDEFLNCLKVMILNNEFKDTFKMRMGRMLCFVCKSKRNYDYLKSFIYDLVISHEFTMPLIFQNLVLLFARIWPESLTWPCSIDQINDEDMESLEHKNPILFSMIYLVREKILKNNLQLESINHHSSLKYSDFSNYYIYILECLCNWSVSYSSNLDIWNYLKISLEKVLDSLEAKDFFISDENTFKLNNILRQYVEAFKILCLKEGWKWTKEYFISQYLKNEIDRLQLNESDVKQRNIYCFYTLVSSDIICTMCPLSDSDFAIEKIKNLGTKIHYLEKEKVFVPYEFSLVESLLVLSSFDPMESFKIIESWFDIFKKRLTQQKMSIQIPRVLENKIRTTQGLHVSKT